jgi:hypothetical protein
MWSETPNQNDHIRWECPSIYSIAVARWQLTMEPLRIEPAGPVWWRYSIGITCPTVPRPVDLFQFAFQFCFYLPIIIGDTFFESESTDKHTGARKEHP